MQILHIFFFWERIDIKKTLKNSVSKTHCLIFQKSFHTECFFPVVSIGVVDLYVYSLSLFQCLNFAPQLINVIEQGVDPSEACQKIGLCDSTRDNISG